MFQNQIFSRRGLWWFFLFLPSLPLFSQVPARQYEDELKIWFNHPAKNWNEALPVGNGRLGAMVFGGITSERLQLNEETIWSGKPEDFANPNSRKALPHVRELLFAGKYAEAQKLAQSNMMGDRKTGSNYQTLGDLQLEFLNQQNISDYRRELDLETAVARVSYRTDKAFFTREIFSSAPDQALVVQLTADKAGALSFNLNYSRPGNKAKIEAVKDELTVSEHINGGVGVKMVLRLKVLKEGGTITANGGGLSVVGANTVTLLITAATDYRGTDPLVLAGNQLINAQKKTFLQIKADHIKDYQGYFKRLDLDLGRTDAVYFPTDTRILAMQNGNIDPSC